MRATTCLVLSVGVLSFAVEGERLQSNQCASPANEIVAENCKPGHPADGMGRERIGRSGEFRASRPTSA